MKVLVTGGAGFIGSAVVRHLIQATDWHVCNVDKLTYAGNRSSLKPIEGSERYHFVQADVCDGAAMREVFTSFEPDRVLHMAAESHVDRSIDGPGAFIQTNILGTYELLNAALFYHKDLSAESQDQFRFIMLSTDEVYGSLGAEGSFNEQSPYDPRNPYSASKAAGNHLARAWQHTFDLPVIIVNSANNYGPYQLPEKLIPLMILSAMHGQPLPVYGTGENVRDWLHVEDHARILGQIVAKGTVGETYCIGGNNERSNLQVVQTLCDLMDELAPAKQGSHRDRITFVTDRPGHDLRYALDTTKVDHQFDTGAAYSFEEGLRQTVQWYLDNVWWWQPIRERSVGGKRHGLLSP